MPGKKPERSPVGTSGATRLKWERLGTLLEMHAKIVKGIIKNAQKRRDTVPTYFYIDPYSGPGFYDIRHDPELAGMIGSPLIAIRALRAAGCKVYIKPNVGFDGATRPREYPGKPE